MDLPRDPKSFHERRERGWNSRAGVTGSDSNKDRIYAHRSYFWDAHNEVNPKPKGTWKQRKQKQEKLKVVHKLEDAGWDSRACVTPSPKNQHLLPSRRHFFDDVERPRTAPLAKQQASSDKKKTALTRCATAPHTLRKPRRIAPLKLSPYRSVSAPVSPASSRAGSTASACIKARKASTPPARGAQHSFNPSHSGSASRMGLPSDDHTLKFAFLDQALSDAIPEASHEGTVEGSQEEKPAFCR